MKWVFARFFVLSLISAVGFATIAVLVGVQAISGFDNAIISYVQGQESQTLTQVMKFFTFIGTGLPITVISLIIMIVLYKVLNFRRELLFFIGVVIGSALLNVFLKSTFHRARPTLNRFVEATGYSFPSGHSMAAFTLYGVICFLLWKHAEHAYFRFILVCCSSIMIIAIGISRIYLGVHYPSDVVGAYLASGTWLAVSIGLYQRLFAKHTLKVDEGTNGTSSK